MKLLTLFLFCLLIYRERDDVTQLHRQQKQLVTELKSVQNRRNESTGDDYNANTYTTSSTNYSTTSAASGNNYVTERDVFVTAPSNEPSAYTGNQLTSDVGS